MVSLCIGINFFDKNFIKIWNGDKYEKATTLTILEYKVNEISNKPFYIKEHNEKYNLKEIKQILIKLSN